MFWMGQGASPSLFFDLAAYLIHLLGFAFHLLCPAKSPDIVTVSLFAPLELFTVVRVFWGNGSGSSTSLPATNFVHTTVLLYLFPATSAQVSL